MKKIIILFTVVLSFGNAYSQQNTFSKVFTAPDNTYYEHASLSTYDNGFLIVGNTEWSTNMGMVLKVDSNGDFVWAKAFRNAGNPPNLAAFEFTGAINTFDSAYFICGYYKNDQNENDEGVCLKMTTDGDTIWTTTIVTEHNLILNSACQTSDSGYVVTGNVNWYENQIFIEKLFVAKLSPGGTMEWSKEYTFSGDEINGCRVVQASDGNLIIAGNIDFNNKSFLLKMSATGNVLWAKEYGLGGTFKMVDFQGLIETDNGFVIYSFVNRYAALVKTDTAGNIVWEKTTNVHSQPPFGWSSGMKMNLCPLNNGGFAFVTFNSSNGGLIKTDSLGNPAFFYNLILSPVDVHETNNKELFITGNGPLIGVKRADYDPPEIGIIQADSTGTGTECIWDYSPVYLFSDTLTVTPFGVTVADAGNTGNTVFDVNAINIPLRKGCVDMVGDVHENKPQKSLKVYPNPASGNVTFEAANEETGNLLIFNEFGINIINKELKNHKTSIDLSEYGDGVYYYRFTCKDGRSIGGKVVVE